MYIVLFANCNPVNGRLLLNGHTEWVNPYGYLPGEYYHAMPFYFTLAIIYVVLAFLWYGLSCLTYRHLLIMVSALVDAAFYAWTFHSLSWVLAHLKTKARPRPELTSLYRRFVGVLIVGGVFSFAWAIFGVVQTTGDRRDVHWELDWAVVAVWEVLYLYLLIAVCVLLRPRMDGATSFGYSAVEMAERDTNQLMGDHDEELEYGGRQLSGDDEFAVAEETAFRKGKMAD
eukprot:TRINITY_DN2577_c2_g2_i2.p2 TRINITY_DN2577_c2_g2~~TRINITY_DN2577_c2_g2_i2.p2  ORF type:complete len:229 (+),score=90.90 TRINITY_DN2577_c2_g2_i2:156-842(+)